MATQDEILQRGIAAARAGQVDEARQWFAQVIKINPQSEVAWLWMSSVVQTDEQRVYCLQQVLAINPQNEMALKGMQALSSPPAASMTAQPAPAPTISAPDGVPLIDAGRISQAQRAAEEILRAIRDEDYLGTLDIAWAAPEKVQKRARPTIAAFSPQMMMIGGSIVAATIVIIIIVMIANASSNRQHTVSTGPVEARPSATPTVTPRPTRTPTPVGTVFNPGPTIAAADAPRGDLRYGRLTATPPYVSTPHPASPRMNDALLSFFSGNYNEALEFVKRAREAGDDSVDGYWVEGMSFAYLDDIEQAKLALQGGLERDPSFAPIHAGMGYVHIQEGSMAQARTSIEKAIELDPKLVMAYITLAKIELREGNYEAALQAVEDGKAASKSKYDVTLLVMQGEIYMSEGEYAKAAELGNLAYYIDPGSEEVVLLLGRSRISLGLQDSAVILLEDYLDQINPSSADTWVLLAKAYNKQGRITEATEANRRALQLSGQIADALVSQALLNIDQGKYQEACADLSESLKQNDKNYDARYGRAICSFALGDAKQTIEDLEFVREATPNKPDIETLYIQALVADQQWKKAISIASATYGLRQLEQEQHAIVLENQAYAFYKVGDLNNAFQNIEAALKISETGTRHYYRGLILESLRDYDRAALEYEWVLFWDQVYHYPFGKDLTARLEEVYRHMEPATPTPTPTVTPSPTKQPTQTPTPTRTSTPTQTPKSGTATPSPTTGTVTITPQNTPTSSKTPTPKPSKTPTPKPSQTSKP
ncbi:MAG: tetratricopeptide repeat protein [Anaerolineae bacterium]|nr:tetratricopeptide repeat protein [Anaerolineae bacterium]